MVCGKQRCVLQEIQNFFVSPFFFVFFFFFFFLLFVLSCLVLSCLVSWVGKVGSVVFFLSVILFYLLYVFCKTSIHTYINLLSFNTKVAK